jgi:cytochrome b involved in lipid metabolism
MYSPKRDAGKGDLPADVWADPPVAAKKAPCEIVVESAEAINRSSGHANAGFLSRIAGFTPLQQPLTHLPASFHAWDAIATDLPRLIKQQTLRSVVSHLPVLSARPEHLPDLYLLRASTILSILAHAYVHLDDGTPTTLPECIEKPWIEVSSRLGRKKPFLSYIDLIVYNWQKICEDIGTEALRVENLRLLVPTVDNNEENTFYLAQTEMLAQTTPLLNGIVEAQRAVLGLDTASLTRTLREMTEQLRRIGRVSFTKVSASPTRNRRVDPVVWAKTVAPLAVPLHPDVPGPSGTASPLFHMMDAFIGRERYNTILGEEAQKIRVTYPPHWREFIEATGDISISAYVKKTCDKTADAAWHALKEAYRGPEGLLGLHRRKVYAYLPMAFKMGREITIAGFKGNLAEEEWLRVHRELEIARQDRYSADDAAKPLTPGQSPVHSRVRHTISELARHCNAADGYWIAARGQVYNVNSYMRAHPGGDKILLNCAGRDVTSDLEAVSHFQNSFILTKMEKFAIGELYLRTFSDSGLQRAYDYTVAFVYKAVDLQATYRNDVSSLNTALTSAEYPDELTPQKMRFFIAAQVRIQMQYIPTIAAYLLAVANAIRALPHDGPSFATLLDRLDSAQTPSRNTRRPCPSTWNDVRRMTKDAVVFLDSVRINAIALLTVVEAIPESDMLVRKTLLGQSENALATITNSIVRAAQD